MQNLPHPIGRDVQFPRRRFLQHALAGTAALACGPVLFTQRAWAGASSGVMGKEDLAFLAGLSAATLNAARVFPGKTRGQMPPNSQGFPLFTPGGNYPALWVRDFAMSLDCGLVKPDEMLAHLRLIARKQNGPSERRLSSGGLIPPFAVPDHVSFDGGAVFYPGTYSAGEDQGANPWGPLPPQDDHYYLVHIAYAVWRETRDASFLSEQVGELSLLERLVRAFQAPTADSATGAAVSPREARAVGFGFQDSVYLVGALSFTTLLRYRAARQLAELCRRAKEKAKGAELDALARRIARHFHGLFTRPDKLDGWLLAATEIGQQADVWATLFALHLGILPPKVARLARETVAAAVEAPGHTVEYLGAVRHVPSNLYFNPGQCWERSESAADTYQSGAFWHTPTGWLIEALKPINPKLAREVCRRYLDHLRREDFRLGKGHGAPWECFGLNLAHSQNPVYLTSVTLPLSCLQSGA